MYFPLTSSPHGLAMKLTYFQHRYAALTTPPSSDHVMSHDQEMGVSARVLVEKSTQHFILPIDPNLFRSLSLTHTLTLSLSHSLTHSLSLSLTHPLFHSHTCTCIYTVHSFIFLAVQRMEDFYPSPIAMPSHSP